ncbi:hypothetical protein BN970_04192 [Mycolicibacterium conceptionense]|uniref:Transmembrane protein n=1 Tax=Mycolicibacterium conceptionense TaxID=451644 RepID=A0A0U1DLL8_9MYCO|nr:hypothetical protein [Mycolicibacterium conceptionense]CQD18804.1 hypothetical protein BN970_04192 [Mycolicibacterium conceptionense]
MRPDGTGLQGIDRRDSPSGFAGELPRLRRAATGVGPNRRDDADVVVDANVTNGAPAPETSGPETDQAQGEPQPVADAQPQQRVWSMPKPEVARKKADEAGRLALRAGTAVGGAIASTARYGGRVAGRLSRAVEAVPPTVRLLAVASVTMLLGIVGAITMQNPLGLLCIVMVVPVCSFTLGVLGHRWYTGLDTQPAAGVEQSAAGPSTPELQRSVEYVDKKLAIALTAFGAERQQHAMIALFQAKTAVELTLGTERDETNHIDALLSVESHEPRPRIRAGSAPKSLRESNSLAAS